MINFDELAKSFAPEQKTKNHFLLPSRSFRLLINGPSGCGKSNLLLNLLLQYLSYDDLLVVCKTPDEDKYKLLAEAIDVINEAHRKKLAKASAASQNPKQTLRGDPKANGQKPLITFKITSDLSEIPNVDESKGVDGKTKIIVFDDMVAEKAPSVVSKIEKIYTFGRKHGITAIYLSQSYYNTPKLIRDNSDVFVLFKMTSQRSIKQLAQDHFEGGMNFEAIYRHCTSKPYGFVYIDKNNPEDALRIRCGIDGVINPAHFGIK